VVSKILFIFTPIPGKDFQFDKDIFQMGLVQPPTSKDSHCIFFCMESCDVFFATEKVLLKLPQGRLRSVDSHGFPTGFQDIFTTEKWIEKTYQAVLKTC